MHTEKGKNPHQSKIKLKNLVSTQFTTHIYPWESWQTSCS